MNRGGRQGAMMDHERRAHQIKEVIRVSAALRADMPPEAICALVVQTIHASLGFRAAVLNLVVPGSRYFAIAATAGISDAERQRLINDPSPVDHIVSLMRPEFQVSRSYFIGHEHKYLLEGAGGIILLTPSAFTAQRAPNSWHPDDVFIVPLYSVRDNRLLGIISLDLPEDGKIPSFETVEVIELLAIQAATALDTARLFQERTLERQALEHGLVELLAHLERMRQRDLSARVQLRTTSLNQVAAALNDVSATLGNILADVREAGMVVQQQASAVRNAAGELTRDAQLQAEQIHSASTAIHRTSEQMRQIARRAADSSAIAEEAESISSEGREAAERAGEGMNSVREITLQAAKRIKRLGESSQEIGNVIQLVSEFASQTHLLALNAAIEAANAGEHGSGFAIVAREIRNLAQNSNDATKQIHARIKGIQNETNQVAITIEHATQQVVLLSDLVTHTATALHALDTVIQRITNVIATVHQTAEEQAKTTATVSDTMNAIAGITGTTWESAENMRASMDRLAELAGILQAKIEMFRLGERIPANGAVSFPTQAPAPHSGMASARSTTQPAASYPATPFPATSQPGATPPATPFPPRAFTNAPATDPFRISGPPTPAARMPASDDTSLQATVPMSAIHRPPAGLTPQRAPMPGKPLAPTAEAASAAPDRQPPTYGNVPTPAPLFPVSGSPFTPIRLSALDDDAPPNTDSAQRSGDGLSVPPDPSTGPAADSPADTASMVEEIADETGVEAADQATAAMPTVKRVAEPATRLAAPSDATPVSESPEESPEQPALADGAPDDPSDATTGVAAEDPADTLGDATLDAGDEMAHAAGETGEISKL